MKTRTAKQKFYLNNEAFVLITILILLSSVATAQENDSEHTLFSSDVKISETWTPEVKINSIQGDVGTLIGFYGGAVFNRSVLLGISGGVNLSHPRVNYGYFGVVGQYIYRPANLWHCSGQILLASGSTKDYENPKSGLLDNFWNISGTSFYLIEPGINLELNLSKRLTLLMGISYR